MHPVSDSLRGARVGVIGAGRVGTALCAALREAGVAVEGPAGRGEVPRGCDALVLCVPDAEIPAAAATVAGAARLVGHTSGATPLSALAPAGGAAFGMHPLQTFAERAAPADASAERTAAEVLAGPAARAPAARTALASAERTALAEAAARAPANPFAGAGCAVAGSTPAAVAFATRLARALDMTPFEIDDAGRAAYHAAASVASNFLVTLQAAAESIAAGAGLEPEEARALLAPLLRRTVDNLAALGPERALTGPIARGDERTVEAQRRAIEEAAPHLLELFDELVHHTRSLAGRGVPA